MNKDGSNNVSIGTWPSKFAANLIRCTTTVMFHHTSSILLYCRINIDGVLQNVAGLAGRLPIIGLFLSWGKDKFTYHQLMRGSLPVQYQCVLVESYDLKAYPAYIAPKIVEDGLRWVIHSNNFNLTIKQQYVLGLLFNDNWWIFYNINISDAKLMSDWSCPWSSTCALEVFEAFDHFMMFLYCKLFNRITKE